MKVLDLTFSSPEENLACDEAILETCEAGQYEETLRFWEPKQIFAVLGLSNKVESELKKEVCLKERIPILRRVSGGGTILQGPGCLNYALILDIKKHPELATVTGANRFIMNRNKEALAGLIKKEVTVEGHTDLVADDLKFSGNSQRRKRRFILFHGTFLLHFDLKAFEKYLCMPSQEPSYRKKRAHSDFLTNLKIRPSCVKTVLKKTWGAKEIFSDPPHAHIRRLAASTYSKPEWTFKF